MWILLVLMLALAGTLLYLGRPLWSWTLPLALALAWWWVSGANGVAFGIVGGLAVVLVLGLTVPAIRRPLVTSRLMPAMSKIMPRMSETERIALDAGTVWWDAEIFSGRPDWTRLLGLRSTGLTEKEREFLAGPVEQVCGMVTDHQLAEEGDLPEEVWSFLRDNGFFGMIVPESYGGLGFSALAHSAVVTKLASRSIGLSVTVMVPNSLGPAELILHYGTDEQKDHYLPRLARGEDIPCFALTEPSAGSDAGSMQSTGVVCRDRWKGEEVVGIRLDWDKRYITMSPVATLIGLAFRLEDPEHLLGEKDDVGITCALVPADLPGIEIGERHDPLGVPFHNGPTKGKGVFVPLDAIIGGAEMAGHGWKMLMQSLAAGRGISLPSMSVGAAELTTRTVGAYATIREQFGLPIGKFEGIEEALARIGGTTYAMDSARLMTLAGIDMGEKPSVLTAVMKCYLSEGMRGVVNDGMDVLAGAGISRGPRNVLAGAYTALPIAITVEGANILTRSMIVFGQGAIRCHPHAQEEIRAVAERDLAAFDRHFFGHVGFVFTNAVRSLALGITAGRIASEPTDGPAGPMFRELTRTSAAFAFLADVCMGTLGGSLKLKEKITGRLADAFAWQYVATAALKRFVDEGQRERDLPYVRWATHHAHFQIQEAMLGVLRNLPMRWLGVVLRPVLFPLGARRVPPSDELGSEVAKGLLEDGEARQHLTRDIYLPPPSELGLGQMEDALETVVRAHAVKKKIREAVKAKQLDKRPKSTLTERARAAGIVGDDEVEVLAAADRAREAVVAVDAFEPLRESPVGGSRA